MMIRDDYLYVDKTRTIYELIEAKRFYFLSRPRRFGKSLLVSTLKSLFLGQRELFKGLWIEASSNYSWQEHPVISLDFSDLDSESPTALKQTLSYTLQTTAELQGIDVSTAPSPGLKLKKLVTELAKSNRVVILIDEYDYPILSALATPTIAEENRNVLKNFFSVLKGLDGYLRAIFVTGVTKFSKSSLFSGLNNLNDLTMDKAAATLLGYTEEEIVDFFSPYIEIIAQERNQTFENILQEMKYWYNGYRFSAKEIKVYNPYSVLNYLFEKEQHNYWLETGTPTFLIPLLRKQYRSLDNLKTVELSSEALGTVEVADIPAITLLYQTGYLTISGYDELAKLYTLDFPNAEVKDTFNKYLLMSLSQTNLPTIESTISQLKHALNDTNMPLFCTILQSLFAHIPYSLDAKDEQFYHKFFQLLCNLFAIDAQSEVLTDKGRIDMVATTATHIFIFEFKLHADAQAALTQVEEKRYYEKYLLSNKKVGLVGISFALENKKPQLECAYKEMQSPLQKKLS